MFDPAPYVDLAKRLAPELADVPVYLLSVDQVAGIPAPSDASGWVLAGDTMHAAYIDRIVDYRGPGPLIVLDDNHVRMAAKPGKFTACLTACLIHELAHVLPLQAIEDAPRTPRAVAASTAFLERSLATPTQRATETVDPFHDWRWIRRCAHLFTRATGIPVEVYAADVLGYPDRLSPLNHYLPLLAEECDRLKGADFATIDAEPAPRGLIDYYRADLQFHRKENP